MMDDHENSLQPLANLLSLFFVIKEQQIVELP